jgi:hypothetical protein
MPRVFQLWTAFLIFHISIRINCNRTSEGLPHNFPRLVCCTVSKFALTEQSTRRRRHNPLTSVLQWMELCCSSALGDEWSASRPGRFTLGQTRSPVPIAYKAAWAPEPVWKLWRRESLAHAGNRTPILRTSSPQPPGWSHTRKNIANRPTHQDRVGVTEQHRLHFLLTRRVCVCVSYDSQNDS